MHFSLVHRLLVCWFGSMSLLILLSNRGLSETNVQVWIDSISAWIETYDELAQRAAEQSANQPEVELDVVLEELDRRREEARIDCLANRLLAEEYQPYDFDIRETMWCKGSLALPISTLCPTETELAAVDTDDILDGNACNTLPLNGEAHDFWDNEATWGEPSQPLVVIPGMDWVATIRSHVWAGFESRLRTHWDNIVAHTQSVTDAVQLAMTAIESHRWENTVVSSPSLRHVFGRSVLPREVVLSSEEYSKIAIQLWRELQANADRNGILSHSPWYELRSTNLEPLYDLAVRLPSLFRKN
jgi:hypothetical protein